jgi:hypothetical protein
VTYNEGPAPRTSVIVTSSPMPTSKWRPSSCCGHGQRMTGVSDRLEVVRVLPCKVQSAILLRVPPKAFEASTRRFQLGALRKDYVRKSEERVTRSSGIIIVLLVNGSLVGTSCT